MVLKAKNACPGVVDVVVPGSSISSACNDLTLKSKTYNIIIFGWSMRVH